MYNGTLGAKHTGHRTKQRKQQHRKIHSPLSLHYVLFGQGGDQLRRLERVFEDSPISLLPQISHDVNHYSIEAPAPINKFIEVVQ